MARRWSTRGARGVIGLGDDSPRCAARLVCCVTTRWCVLASQVRQPRCGGRSPKRADLLRRRWPQPGLLQSTGRVCPRSRWVRGVASTKCSARRVRSSLASANSARLEARGMRAGGGSGREVAAVASIGDDASMTSWTGRAWFWIARERRRAARPVWLWGGRRTREAPQRRWQPAGCAGASCCCARGVGGLALATGGSLERGPVAEDRRSFSFGDGDSGRRLIRAQPVAEDRRSFSFGGGLGSVRSGS